MCAATFTAGVWLSYVVCGASTVYIVCTWERPHRVALAVIFGTAFMGTAAVSALPRERIVNSRWRETFFLTWSLAGLTLIALAMLLDGGAAGPLALVLFVPAVFAAMAYPLRSVAVVAGISVAYYVAVATTVGGGSRSYEALFTVMLSCTGAMGAWQARNHERQHVVLIERSRTDSLTGRLNRRGFEERAPVGNATVSHRAGEGSIALNADERLSWAAALARTVDMRMNNAHEHSRAVAEHAVAMARALGWEQDALGLLRIAAMLHDVGKVTVPDSVLRKPGRLTAEELELIKGHSVAGAELVCGVEGLEAIVPWIRHSHEHFDGSGYPDRLRGEEIPQASRIMLVADAFDAITTSRPYREALTIEHACAELKRHAGGQFDPRCVAALLSCMEADTPSSGANASLQTPSDASPVTG
jgi:putative nucleotidyltransferase with HDIG domain